MATTARFEVQRHAELEAVFKPSRMVRVWRDLVKQQLRRLEVPDLHDYYDFNFNIERRCEAIAERILSGQYRAETPLVYKIEKKLGISRHMILPSPSDALVFQVLTDSLFEELVKAQPSKQAFYARDRHTLKLPHELKESLGYPWFFLWPKFQEKIWGFTSSHPILVTTDLTNYYDNIALDDLRRVIAGHVHAKEALLDLLFSLIEDLTWRPDYLPRSKKGLPTIQIEAPRLMAHALLFEVDSVLKNRTNDSFVRWMDDINFGVKSQDQASKVLGELSDVLKSRGLALNLAKTQLLSAADAKRHFMFNENKRIDRLQARAAKLKSPGALHSFGDKVSAELVKHLKECDAKNKDKATKRYFSLLGQIKHAGAVSLCVPIYRSGAGLRSTVIRYLTRLQYCRPVSTAILHMLEKTRLVDDVTKVELVQALVDWTVPLSLSGKRFLGKVRKCLENPVTFSDWLCWFLFLSKYGEAHEALTAYEASKSIRRKEPFVARQAATLLCRGISVNAARVREFWDREVSTGLSDSASVAVNLQQFSVASFPSKKNKLYSYLFPDKASESFPIAKFLLLCLLAVSERDKGLKVRREIVAARVTDPWMRAHLKSIHPVWFT